MVAQVTSVANNTSISRKKFHYDNGALLNSVMATTSGAGQYYSGAASSAFQYRDYLPNAEGFVYAATEYFNDGQSKPKKNSGVGKELRMEGGRASQYLFGNAATSEVVRLFGSNAGLGLHYRKDVTIDPNNQATISYRDQEGRVIATALVGASPVNMEKLSTDVSSPLTVDVSRENFTQDGKKIILHKILNIAPTTYTFTYSFSSLASDLTSIGAGCVACKYNVKIVVTDPDGTPMTITATGNQSVDGKSF